MSEYDLTPTPVREPENERPQQLLARIKRSSKYWGQTKPNVWFPVRVCGPGGHCLRGNRNDYRLSDVALGIRLDDGTIVDFTKAR